MGNTRPGRSRRLWGAIVGAFLVAAGGGAAGIIWPAAAARLLTRVGIIRQPHYVPPPPPPRPRTRPWTLGPELEALADRYAADQERLRETPIMLTMITDFRPAYNGVRLERQAFSLLVEGLERVVLVDAGMDPKILAHNARVLGKSLADVDVLIISHLHPDHYLGLPAFEGVHRIPVAYVPISIGREELDFVSRYVGEVRRVKAPARLLPGLYTTGLAPGKDAEWDPDEIDAVIVSPQGPILVVPCAHAGRLPHLDHARRLTGRRIYIDLGGYCPLRFADDAGLDAEWERYKQRDPAYVGFCHCARGRVRTRPERDWPARSLKIGGGTIIRVPAGPAAAPTVISEPGPLTRPFTRD